MSKNLNAKNFTVEAEAQNCYEVVTLSLLELIELYRSGEITIPPIQRVGGVWAKEKVIGLYETIANSLPMPSFILGKINDRLYLVDGQQRTLAGQWLIDLTRSEELSLEDFEDYEVTVQVISFQKEQELSAYYLNVNASSSLTLAQKKKALMTFGQCEEFNKVAYNEDLFLMLEKETVIKHSTIFKSDEAEAPAEAEKVKAEPKKEAEKMEVPTTEWTKSGKVEEYASVLLTIDNMDKKELSKSGFTTSAGHNFKYITIECPLFSASDELNKFITLYREVTDKYTEAKLRRMGTMAMFYAMVKSESMKMSDVKPFMEWLHKAENSVQLANIEGLFTSGEGNTARIFHKRMISAKKIYDKFRNEKGAEKIGKNLKAQSDIRGAIAKA